jgi:hypothetical protein
VCPVISPWGGEGNEEGRLGNNPELPGAAAKRDHSYLHQLAHPEPTGWRAGLDTSPSTSRVFCRALVSLITKSLTGEGEQDFNHRVGCCLLPFWPVFSRTSHTRDQTSGENAFLFFFTPDFSSQRLPDTHGLGEGGRRPLPLFCLWSILF